MTDVPKLAREKTASTTNLSIPETNSTSNLGNDTNRFGGKSYNMFFIRHTAQPRNLRLFTGNNNIELCTMKDNTYQLPDAVKDRIKSESLAQFNLPPPPKPVETIGDKKFAIKMDDNLIKKYENRFVAKRRKERILPPIKLHTCTFTLADDTLKWREELNGLGKSIGILTEEEMQEANEKRNEEQVSLENKIDEIAKYEEKLLESNLLLNMYLNTPRQQVRTAEPKQRKFVETPKSRSKTGRFNEAKSNTAYSRKASRRGTGKSKYILCAEEAEREMWLLQILCQILKTESMQEIQSWLCSSSPSEKGAMKELIQKSLDGLNQAGRIEKDNNSDNGKENQIDFDHISSSITSFVDNQRNVHKLSVLSHHQISNNNNQNKNSNQSKSPTEENNNKNRKTSGSRANNVLTTMKFSIEKKQTNEKKKQKPQKANFVSDSCENFNSQSLINMESNYGSGYGTVNLPYPGSSLGSASKKDKKAERKIKDFSTFDSFLSKSTYFQPKCKAIHDHLLPYSNLRPFTTTENQNYLNRRQSNEELKESTIGVSLHPHDHEIVSKFVVKPKSEEPVKVAEIEARPKTKTCTEIANMEYENNKLLSNANQFNVYEK